MEKRERESKQKVKEGRVQSTRWGNTKKVPSPCDERTDYGFPLFLLSPSL